MTEAVLALTKARTELGESLLTQSIADTLSIPQSKLTIIIDEDCATIIVYPERGDIPLDAYDIATKLNGAIQRGEAESWAAGRDATCEVAEDEESVFIDEEEALEMWREMSEETRTGHLDKVPNPDGVLIQPTHETRLSGTTATDIVASPTESHLRRDPTLLDYDNVERVHVSQIHNISWKEPIIITNAIPDETFANIKEGILDKNRLASVHGEVEVRTGNRETLIDNGITNSKPMTLSDALLTTQSSGDEYNNLECGRIVFSPIKELPDEFVNELKPFTDSFPCCTESPMKKKKFTLTLASEGFGIGMHKHKAAMFLLLVGKKKWYMTSSKDLEGDGDTQTHPRFYREKSSHKCIQKQGEVLFVPDDWYHEIFNLEYTAGIQALPSE